MNKNLVIIIHGAYGNSKENWFPWLKSEILRTGVAATTPDFPTPENQTVENWTRLLDKNIDGNYSGLTLVGHSASCAFILGKLETVPTPIKAAFLVSSFIRDLDLPEFDKINGQFYHRDFNWKRIRANCGNFFVFHSDNDPYVPLDCGKEIAEMLNVKLRIIKNGGHLNTEAGYTKFPVLLDEILTVIGDR